MCWCGVRQYLCGVLRPRVLAGVQLITIQRHRCMTTGLTSTHPRARFAPVSVLGASVGRAAFPAVCVLCAVSDGGA